MIYYKDGIYELQFVNYVVGIDFWKFVIKMIDIKKDYVSYIVFVQYNYINGIVYFDDLLVV